MMPVCLLVGFSFLISLSSRRTVDFVISAWPLPEESPATWWQSRLVSASAWAPVQMTLVRAM